MMGIAKLVQAFIACPNIDDAASDLAKIHSEHIMCLLKHEQAGEAGQLIWYARFWSYCMTM